jgi:DNA-3-methyladenine glycosylase I
MQVPEKIQPCLLADYLEVMIRSVFQTGLSWRVVDSKWPGIRDALRGFDPEAIAMISESDLDELAQDRRVIRNRRKLEAIVGNARRMLELDEAHGSFRDYLRSHGGFEEAVKDLRKQFKYLGDMGAYHFLWVVGEEVPSYEEWCRSRGVEPQPMA